MPSSSRGGRLLELLRTANMSVQRKASPSKSCTQCLTKRAHGTHRYTAGPRSVLQQQFVSALLLAVVAGAHAALVAVLLWHRQAFRTPPELLPTTIAVSLVSPPQSTPPSVSAPVPTAPPPPEPAAPVAAEPPPTLSLAGAKAKPAKPKPRPNRAVRPPEPPPPAPATPPAPAAPTASPSAGPPSTATASPTPPRFSAYTRNNVLRGL